MGVLFMERMDFGEHCSMMTVGDSSVLCSSWALECRVKCAHTEEDWGAGHISSVINIHGFCLSTWELRL